MHTAVITTETTNSSIIMISTNAPEAPTATMNATSVAAKVQLLIAMY